MTFRPAARTSTEGAGPVVEVTGELTHHSVTDVVARLDEALLEVPVEVVVDLEHCPYIDATGLEALVDVHARAQRAGSALVLRHCCARVLRLLSLTGLRRVFQVRSGAAGGDGARRRRQRSQT